MKKKGVFLWGVLFSFLLIGFVAAQENVVYAKHEIIAIFADDESLLSIQGKGDAIRVAVLGSYVSDEDDEINHIISLSDDKVQFHHEYYAYKSDQVRLHLTITGPTLVESSSGWLTAKKGFQYKSIFTYEDLKAVFKKGLYEVHFHIEVKNEGAGAAYSERCLVKIM